MRKSVILIMILSVSFFTNCKDNRKLSKDMEKIQFVGTVKKYGNESSFIGKSGNSGPKVTIGIETEDGKIYTIHSDYIGKIKNLQSGVYRFEGFLKKNESGKTNYFSKDGVFIPLEYVLISNN